MSNERLLEDGLENCPGQFLAVPELFGQHPKDAIKHIQQKGLQRTESFELEDNLVFKAFQDKPLLTLGNDSAYLDHKAVWTQHLQQKHKWKPHCCDSYTQQQQQQEDSNKVAIQSFVVPIKHAANLGDAGLIRPLLRRWHAKKCSAAVFSLPAVKAVVQWKWKAYAKGLLLWQLLLYVLWVAAFFVFTAYLQEEEEEEEEDPECNPCRWSWSHHGVLTVAKFVAVAASLPFLYLEIAAVKTLGWRWLAQPLNTVNEITVVMQIVITVMHLSGQLVGTTLSVLISVQCILLLFRFMNLAQAMRQTPMSFLVIIAEVSKDIGWVFFFIILTCISFGSAFYITMRHDRKEKQELSTWMRSTLSMYEHIYGDLEFKEYYGTHEETFAVILAAIYIWVMGFVAVNLLIGVVINALDKIMDKEGINQALSQAQCIDNLECTIPAWLDRPEWHPCYVHCIQIDKSKLDDVSADAFAAKEGIFAPDLLEGRTGEDDIVEEEEEEKEEESHADEQQLQSLQDKVDGLMKALEKQGQMLEKFMAVEG